MNFNRAIFFILFFLTLNSLYCQTATIHGVILDERNNPVESATISTEEIAITSNKNGFYQLIIPAKKEIIIHFKHLSFKKIQLKINLQSGENFEFNPVLQTQIEQIGEVLVLSSPDFDINISLK